MSDIDELQELRSLNRKHVTETTSIHKDMLALAALVGVHYDGLSSPAGFLHGDIMPAVRALESQNQALQERAEKAEAKNANLRALLESHRNLLGALGGNPTPTQETDPE